MDLLLQINYNQTTQFDPSYQANSRKSNREDLMMLNSLFLILAIVGALVWRYLSRRDYIDAKHAFERNPTDPQAKQHLIYVAKKQGNYGRSTNEVMGLLEAQHDHEKHQSQSKKSIASELGTLADLREKGVLTDEEFERAKKKLLS
ncbi:MAG: SHOCT domain-containing protein [Armatimonadota bacterium]